MKRQKDDRIKERKKRSVSRRKIKENLMLGGLALPGIIIVVLFGYLPIFGNVLAFKSYNVQKGILGSDWANPWYNNFKFFFTSDAMGRVVRNTLGLNALFIIVCTVCAVGFGLLLYEVKKPAHVKIYQSFAILPNFLSWVAVSYIVYALLDTDKGIVNWIIGALGGDPVSWYAEPGYWPIILLLVSLWHGLGMSCIIYYAALMGIDQSLYDAAAIDGAGRFKQIIHVSLPSLVPIVVTMTLLNVGSIFRSDFGLFYNVTRNVGMLYKTTDVMDTYVYRALMEVGNIGMSSAASFIQSVVCCITLLTANFVVRKIDPEQALF